MSTQTQTSCEENVFRTPGPWSVDPATGLDVCGVDGKDVCVALCTDMHQLQFNMATIGPQSRQQAYDNARLIAAAPELLEAAKAVLEARSTRETVDATTLLIMAVRKAEGRS